MFLAFFEALQDQILIPGEQGQPLLVYNLPPFVKAFLEIYQFFWLSGSLAGMHVVFRLLHSYLPNCS